MNELYRTYYKGNPKKFIEDLQFHLELPQEQLIERITRKAQSLEKESDYDSSESVTLLEATYAGIMAINRLYGLEERTC